MICNLIRFCFAISSWNVLLFYKNARFQLNQVLTGIYISRFQFRTKFYDYTACNFNPVEVTVMYCCTETRRAPSSAP